jgi:5'-nucleotidase
LKKIEDRIILVTNDDGYLSKGIEALIEGVKPFGHVVVVAPTKPHSGMSHAITVDTPLRMEKIERNSGVEFYTVSGTPADCVKLANYRLFGDKRPALLVSGINHGANSSTSIVYSGTMAAVIEGCFYQIPSVGFSLLDFSHNPDFSAAITYVRKIVKNVFERGLPNDTCLNVNIPRLPIGEIQGIRICRQTKGAWREEFDLRCDPHNREYYWLTGEFHNFEPDAEDTDEWALQHKYVSVVPVMVDFTDYKTMNILKQWTWE